MDFRHIIHSSYDKFLSISDSHHLTLTSNFTQNQRDSRAAPLRNSLSWNTASGKNTAKEIQRKNQLDRIAEGQKAERKSQNPKRCYRRKLTMKLRIKISYKDYVEMIPLFQGPSPEFPSFSQGTSSPSLETWTESWNREDISRCKKGIFKKTQGGKKVCSGEVIKHFPSNLTFGVCSGVCWDLLCFQLICTT